MRLASGVRWEQLTWTMRKDFEFLHVVYEPGDSIHFNAQTPHRIWNAGEGPAAAVWAVLQRQFDDRAP